MFKQATILVRDGGRCWGAGWGSEVVEAIRTTRTATESDGRMDETGRSKKRAMLWWDGTEEGGEMLDVMEVLVVTEKGSRMVVEDHEGE